MVRAGGKCTTHAPVHQCRYGDFRDCTEQCEARDAASCFNLGQMFATGREVTQSHTAAARLWKVACEMDWPDACSNFGAALPTSARATAGARAAARTSVPSSRTSPVMTMGGDIFGCTHLGTMQLYGKAVPRDASLALATFKRGCDGGDKLACVNVAVAYIEGDPPVRNAARGRELLKTQCSGGSEEACGVLRKLGAP
jgi:TPR repeat protein